MVRTQPHLRRVVKVLLLGGLPQAAAWEQELNARVYDVYDLTPDEVALVERETG